MTPTSVTVAHSQEWAATEIDGVGLGLRAAHMDEILINRPAVPWFEILAENHAARGGLIPMQLHAISEQYPITLHCVGMSLAGTSPLNMEYLHNIRRMVNQYAPVYVSDHISFCHQQDVYFHDLLPFPYSDESLLNIIKRVDQVQDFLGRSILVENSTRYIQFADSSLSETEFIRALLNETGCNLLLDISNLYVNSVNHGFDPADYLQEIPWPQVKEIHLAGFEQHGEILLDAHNHTVADQVWELYRLAMKKSAVPTLIEWDSQLPEFSVLLDQADRAEQILQQAATA